MTRIPNYQAPQYSGGGSGLAVASMVLGIISLVLFCVWYIAIPCAIVGLVLGLIAGAKATRGEASGGGMAKAGIICSIIAIVLAILLVVLAIVGFSMFGSRFKQFQQQQLRLMQQQQHAATQPSGNP